MRVWLHAPMRMRIVLPKAGAKSDSRPPRSDEDHHVELLEISPDPEPSSPHEVEIVEIVLRISVPPGLLRMRDARSAHLGDGGRW